MQKTIGGRIIVTVGNQNMIDINKFFEFFKNNEIFWGTTMASVKIMLMREVTG